MRRLPRVAVLIPTYNEGPEILVPTIAAAVAMEPAHETWVLDDGERPEVERLAAALGAKYLARPTHEHAKAGNLNHALGVIQADIIAVLDADHVAASEFLAATLGYFSDPKVALVQTPQDFYNVTSFEHGSGMAMGEPFHEQTLFYRLLQPGKNRWNAAFWCGTNALVRVSALEDVGGAATDTITEDIHTTIRLHRRGWKTVYHNEVLARGLAADDAAQYQLQRNRWGTGAMQVLRAENPLVVSGLTVGQRLGYAATLLGWFDAWRSLGFLLLPPAVLLTGQIPIVADGLTFALIFGVTYVLQQAALFLLGRGAYRPILSIVFDLVRMSPNAIATLTLVLPRTPRFRVTPKGRMAADRGRTEAPILLRLSLAVSFVAAAVYTLHLSGCSTLATRRNGLRLVHSSGSWPTPAWSGWRSAAFGRCGSPPSAAAPSASPSTSRAGSTESRPPCRTCRWAVPWLPTATPLVEREAHLVSFELPPARPRCGRRFARRAARPAASTTTRWSSSRPVPGEGRAGARRVRRPLPGGWRRAPAVAGGAAARDRDVVGPVRSATRGAAVLPGRVPAGVDLPPASA